MKAPKAIKRFKAWIRLHPEQIDWTIARDELKKKQKRHNEKVMRVSQLNLFEGAVTE
jgi:demethoxyubiquinone hydroxylase (CLK1/Coq7/Cat5 family)